MERAIKLNSEQLELLLDSIDEMKSQMLVMQRKTMIRQSKDELSEDGASMLLKACEDKEQDIINLKNHILGQL